MTVLRRRDDGIEIDDDPSRVDRDRTYDLVVGQGYWANERSREAVAASVDSSWCFAVYDGDLQVAFARVVTDRVTFAWICDVIVDEPYRGRGLGHWLMEAVTSSLTEIGVHRQILATVDAHEVYRDLGFSELAHPERWMEIDRRPTVSGPPG